MVFQRVSVALVLSFSLALSRFHSADGLKIKAALPYINAEAQKDILRGIYFNREEMKNSGLKGYYARIAVEMAVENQYALPDAIAEAKQWQTDDEQALPQVALPSVPVHSASAGQPLSTEAEPQWMAPSRSLRTELKDKIVGSFKSFAPARSLPSRTRGAVAVAPAAHSSASVTRKRSRDHSHSTEPVSTTTGRKIIFPSLLSRHLRSSHNAAGSVSRHLRSPHNWEMLYGPIGKSAAGAIVEESYADLSTDSPEPKRRPASAATLTRERSARSSNQFTQAQVETQIRNTLGSERVTASPLLAFQTAVQHV